MLPYADLSRITKGDLEALIGVAAESRTLEFKRELPAKSADEKAKFLAAVTSLANASGGDLVIGVDASGGVLSGVPGFRPSLAEEHLRLEQLLETLVDQRLPRCQFQTIDLGDGAVVMVVRVPRSWLAPHRVRVDDKFYGRNSGGKYPMDVSELRSAFIQADAAAERIRHFHEQRLAKIAARKTPIELATCGRLVLHVVPFPTFAGATTLDIASLVTQGHVMPLPPRQILRSNSHGFNLDGLITYPTPAGGEHRAYCQAFRSGAIEGVDYLGEGGTGGDTYLVGSFEADVAKSIANYRDFMIDLELGFPLYIFLAMTNAKGCCIRVPESGSYVAGGSYHEIGSIGDEIVEFPEAVLEATDTPIHDALRLTFNAMWNAFGYVHSPSYDDNGKWLGWAGSR